MGQKPKNIGHTNFSECCDLTKKVYLVLAVWRAFLPPKNHQTTHSLKIDLASKHRKADLYCRSFGSLSCTITAASCADIFARGFAPNVVLAREERETFEPFSLVTAKQWLISAEKIGAIGRVSSDYN